MVVIVAMSLSEAADATKRDALIVLKEEGSRVVNRGCMFAAVAGLGAGTMGYYRGGRKIGALHGYSMVFGALPVALFAYSALELIREWHGRPTDFKDYIGVGALTGTLSGSLVQTLATRNPMLGVVAGLRTGALWAAGGGIYKLVGDEMWESSRNHWIHLRASHSLPEDDGTVKNVFHRLDSTEAKALYDFTIGPWEALIKEGKFPTPTYGPLAQAAREKEEHELKQKRLEDAAAVAAAVEEDRKKKSGWFW